MLDKDEAEREISGSVSDCSEDANRGQICATLVRALNEALEYFDGVVPFARTNRIAN